MQDSDNKYHEYINGEAWRIRRRAFLETHATCASCGLPDGLHKDLHGTHLEVHHLSYARLGEELDEDLMALCKSCHRKRERLTTKPLDVVPYFDDPGDFFDMPEKEYWDKALQRVDAKIRQSDPENERTWNLVWLKLFAEKCQSEAKHDA